MSTSLEIQIRPDWDEVESVRRKTMEFLAAHRLLDESVQAVGMVASELCENAVKYGNFEGTQFIDVVVRCNEQLSRVSVRVSAPVRIENNPHFRRFKETLDWLQNHENPMEAYLQKMEAVAHTDPDDPSSGLGLPRIAYEGQSLLAYDLDDQDNLAVSAVHYPDRM